MTTHAPIKQAKKRHGGPRRNQTGRPALPEADRLVRIWVSMKPATLLAVTRLAERAGCTAPEYMRRLAEQVAQAAERNEK